MKNTITKLIYAAFLAGVFFAGYQHGTYVGKLDAIANTNALREAGYIAPVAIDNPLPAIYMEGR